LWRVIQDLSVLLRKAYGATGSAFARPTARRVPPSQGLRCDRFRLRKAYGATGSAFARPTTRQVRLWVGAILKHVPKGRYEGSLARSAWKTPNSGARPVGYGVMGGREGTMVSGGGRSVAPQINLPRRRRIRSALFQALHTWLPSYRPSGTKVSFLMLMLFRGRGMRGSDHSGATRHKTTCI